MEIQKPVDQLKHPAITLITARPDLFARQGSVNATWRRRNGLTFGPYYRLSYRDDGRQCAVYLGREGPLVQHVRHLLQNAQNPLRQKQIFARIEHETRLALRANNARLAALLRPLGLRLKGCEVRGWRTSSLRPWLPPKFGFPSGTPSAFQTKHTTRGGNPLAIAIGCNYTRMGLPIFPGALKCPLPPPAQGAKSQYPSRPV